MKMKDTAKVAALTFAVGMTLGVAGEMYMMKSGKMKTARRKATRAIRAMENIVGDVKDIMG